MIDWSDDDLRDEEFPDDEDNYDSDEVDTIPCPECGADVYEEAEQCPACGWYITSSSNPLSGRSWWWIALGMLGIIAVIWALVLY